jgi:Zn-dependent protease with chaperone function
VTIAWISYGIVVSALISVGAESAHRLGRRAGLPTRWVWMSAIGLTLLLIAVAPYRETASPDRPGDISVTTAQLSESSPTGIALEPRLLWEALRRASIAPLERGIATVDRTLPRSANYYLMALWIFTSCTLLLVMLGVYVRVARVRRLWDTMPLYGVRVRVAAEMGPAVVGLANPEIVIPHSLLDRTEDEIKLVITHESEHLRARDSVLLVFGCVVAALLPWNPALWWMLRRLRLTVELDCDARVLRSGVAPRTYASLLINLAEQCSGFPVGAPALAGIHSHLHQRLVAMKPDTPRLSTSRAVAISSLSLISLLVACETNLPTSADVSRMDAASAEQAARQLAPAGNTITFMVDGSVVTAQAAHAVPADSIASIAMWMQPGEKPQIISISTHKNPGFSIQAPLIRAYGIGSPQAQRSGPHIGLYLINGVHVDQAAVKALDPKSIVSVDVYKSVAATERYKDPLAANGVISITTRKVGSTASKDSNSELPRVMFHAAVPKKTP